MTGSEPDVYRFWEFRLRCDGSSLFRVDKTGTTTSVSLSSRALQLLLLLVERPGRVVSRDEIMRAVWPGAAVEESNLTVQVSALRRALGEGPGESRCIQTVPRRGYRFVAPIEPKGFNRPSRIPASYMGADEDEREHNDAPSRSAALPKSAPPALVVLPFYRSGAKQTETLLCELIPDAIRTALARYPFITVYHPYVTGEQYTSNLDLRYIIEGRISTAAGQFRLNVWLVDVDSRRYLWSERFDRRSNDPFLVQDDVSEAVTTAIIPVIAYAEQLRAIRSPTDELTAWTAYQRGLFHQARNSAVDCQIALEFFRRAIELDPFFSAGYRGLALATLDAATQFQRGGIEEVRASAHSHAAQAIALDPTDSAAHSALASVLMIGYGDNEGAVIEAERAIALTPNLASAHGLRGAALTYSGDPKSGLPAVAKSINLNPHGPSIRVRLTQLIAGLFFPETMTRRSRRQNAQSAGIPIIRRRIVGLRQLMGEPGIW